MGNALANGLISHARETGRGFGGGPMGSQYSLPVLISHLRGEETPQTLEDYKAPRFNSEEFLRPQVRYGPGPGGGVAAAGIAEDTGPGFTDIFSGQRSQFQ